MRYFFEAVNRRQIAVFRYKKDDSLSKHAFEQVPLVSRRLEEKEEDVNPFYLLSHQTLS